MRNGGDKKVSQCFFVKRIVDSDARREYIGSVALGRVFWRYDRTKSQPLTHRGLNDSVGVRRCEDEAVSGHLRGVGRFDCRWGMTGWLAGADYSGKLHPYTGAAPTCPANWLLGSTEMFFRCKRRLKCGCSSLTGCLPGVEAEQPEQTRAALCGFVKDNGKMYSPAPAPPPAPSGRWSAGGRNMRGPPKSICGPRKYPAIHCHGPKCLSHPRSHFLLSHTTPLPHPQCQPGNPLLPRRHT